MFSNNFITELEYYPTIHRRTPKIKSPSRHRNQTSFKFSLFSSFLVRVASRRRHAQLTTNAANPAGITFSPFSSFPILSFSFSLPFSFLPCSPSCSLLTHAPPLCHALRCSTPLCHAHAPRDARHAARPLPEPSHRLYCCRNQRRKGTSPRVASSCRASKPWTLCAAVVEHSAPPRFFSRANRLWLPINRAESRRCAPHNFQPPPLQHTAEPTPFFFL